jgi:hypothetical protein
VSPGGAAAQVVDVVDISEASAALVALQIDAGVIDRVCEAMVVEAAEIGHVAGDRFLQIVVDEGVKPLVAMKLRAKLCIRSVVPPRRVCHADLVGC